jgi:hypothetical protein
MIRSRAASGPGLRAQAFTKLTKSPIPALLSTQVRKRIIYKALARPRPAVFRPDPALIGSMYSKNVSRSTLADQPVSNGGYR